MLISRKETLTGTYKRRYAVISEKQQKKKKKKKNKSPPGLYHHIQMTENVKPRNHQAAAIQ